MIKIQTKAYGLQEIEEKQIITIPQGIFGFENLRKYALIDAHQKPFFWLQSLEDPEVAFILIKPNVFREKYDPGIDLTELADLEVSTKEDLITFAIVTVPQNGTFITANLQGPILVNRHTRVGRQCISPRDEYRTRHNILEEMAAMKKEQPC